MQALSIASTFELAVFVEENDKNEDEDGDESQGDSLWKLKRKRNGLKGRTPKHPLNKRPYTC